MHDLQLLGVHDDGEHVVFLGADGQQYRAPIDDALRAAVRRDRARLGQIQISAQPLRPRDIQAAIRAGRTAEHIASEAGLPVDYVRRFEGPVVAERENVVLRARQSRVRRRDEVGPELGRLADERLETRGVDLQAGTTWDAWREDDGTWTVQVLFAAGGKERAARWRFDIAAAHLTAADDESKWLTSEHYEAPGRGQRNRDEAAAEHEGTLDRVMRRRLETVEIATPWSGGAPRPGTSRFPAAAPQTVAGESGNVVDEPRSAADELVNADESEPTREPDSDPPLLLRQDDLPPPAHPADSHPEDLADATILGDPGAQTAGSEVEQEKIEFMDMPESSSETAEPQANSPDEPKPAPQPKPSGKGGELRPKPRPPRKSSSNRRASVPSWDDILFGAKKD